MQNVLVGRYQRMGEIGRGGFGVVEEFLDLVTGNTVAIKTIPPYFVHHESKRMIREVDIMRFLHNAHPHVIDFIAMFATRCQGGTTSQISNPEPYAPSLDVTGPLYGGLSKSEKAIMHHDCLAKELSSIRKEEGFSLHIVMPLMRGDLFYFINLLSSSSGRRQHKIGEGFLKQVAAVFAFQLIFGLDWVHKCGIVHRDLKPDNVLVRLNTENAFYSSLCIADFGLARNVQSSDTFYVCTRNYRPPEIITSAILSQPSMDIWSLGCILYEMCTGETLFKMPTALDSHGVWNGVMASSQLEIILSIVGTPNDEDIMQYMPEGNAKTYLLRSVSRPSRLEKLMEQRWTLSTLGEETLLWRNLIKSCLAFFPQQRPTAEELSRHPLFIHHRMIVGRNIHQIETQLYQPSIPESELNSKMAQMRSLLRIIADTMDQIRPTHGEEGEEEYFMEEEENIIQNSWDGVRHHTTTTLMQATKMAGSEENREKEQEDEEGSGTAYLSGPCWRGQPEDCVSCASEVEEVEGGPQSRDIMQPFELSVPAPQGGGGAKVMEVVYAPEGNDGQGWHAGHPWEAYQGNEYRSHEATVDMAGIPWNEGSGVDAAAVATRDRSRDDGDVAWTTLRLSGQGNRAEEAPSVPFTTSAYLLQRNGTVASYNDPNAHENDGWSAYLHEQPYQNNMHVYNVKKPYLDPRKNSCVDRRLSVGEDGSESNRASISRTSSKGYPGPGGRVSLLPKDTEAQPPRPPKPSSHKPGAKSKYTLLSTSLYEGSDTSNNTAQLSLSVSRPETVPFPDIHNSALRLRYGNLDHTEDTLQAAIESILDELNSNRRDMAISLELRALLSYFCALRGNK